jgi:hypothetical protein
VKVAAADTDLDILRDDPRFQKLLSDAFKRLRIEQPATSASAAAATPTD